MADNTQRSLPDRRPQLSPSTSSSFAASLESSSQQPSSSAMPSSDASRPPPVDPQHARRRVTGSGGVGFGTSSAATAPTGSPHSHAKAASMGAAGGGSTGTLSRSGSHHRAGHSRPAPTPPASQRELFDLAVQGSSLATSSDGLQALLRDHPELVSSSLAAAAGPNFSAAHSSRASQVGSAGPGTPAAEDGPQFWREAGKILKDAPSVGEGTRTGTTTPHLGAAGELTGCAAVLPGSISFAWLGDRSWWDHRGEGAYASWLGFSLYLIRA